MSMRDEKCEILRDKSLHVIVHLYVNDNNKYVKVIYTYILYILIAINSLSYILYVVDK